MTFNYIWKDRCPTNRFSYEDCVRSLGISKVTAKILQTRQFQSIDHVKDYWSPRLEDLHDPMLFKDMDQAADRLAQAVRAGEKIVIWGDYDVDGTTSVSLLMRFFRFIGAQVDFHIPDRIKDGYGLNKIGLQRIRQSGAKVVVTVDNGISAIDEALEALDLGLDLIITDHHEVGEVLPQAYSVVNPKRGDCHYPDKKLAGVGVAFKLACATAQTLANNNSLSHELKEFLLRSLAIVAIGTVADLVPLTGENRVLVGYGLHQLKNSPWPGVRALLEIAGCDDLISTSDIAFKLGPRINASGRLSSADVGVRLLVTEDSVAARHLAQELEKSNQLRRTIEQKHSLQALNRVEERGLCDHRVIVVDGEGWHPGVIGIVASRLVERFHLPAFVVAFDGDIGKGSCRGIEGCHLHNLLSEVSHLLEAFGGHAMAAGFTIKKENYEQFKRELYSRVRNLFVEVPRKSLMIDAWIDLKTITDAFVNELGHLAPFGIDNPAPVLAAHSVHVTDVRRMGKDGSHLSFQSVSTDASIKSVAFKAGQLATQMARDSQWDLAFEPKWNTWGLSRYIQLDVKALRPAQGVQ